MKKSIRYSVFETNSSSTHSLIIHKDKGVYKKIPRNELNFEICKISLKSNCPIIDELDKCRYLLSLIATHMYDKGNENEYFTNTEVWLYGDKGKEWFLENEDKILNFNWLVWLNEVIYEECQTTFKYTYETSDFPFISEMQSYEDDNLLDLLNLNEEESNNREVMKDFFKMILFSPIVLEDREEDY